MAELKKDIEEYQKMEKSSRNKLFWSAITVILKDFQSQSTSSAPESRAVTNVASEIDSLLSTKTHEQLKTLESQIRNKLSSDEPVDVDYWNHLLHSLKIWKAKSQLKEMALPILQTRPKPAPKTQPEEQSKAPELSKSENDNKIIHDEVVAD